MFINQKIMRVYVLEKVKTILHFFWSFTNNGWWKVFSLKMDVF